MSDFISCCSDGVVDDVGLLERGILMMRALFSQPVNFGPYAKVADRYRFITSESAENGIDINDWTERHRGGVVQRPVIYVTVEDVQIGPPVWTDDIGQPTEDGATSHFTYHETARLIFRAVSRHGAESRLLSRIILTYLQGTKNLLPNSSLGQVDDFRPAAKTSPTKLKDENNADNLWASDVIVNVQYQISINAVLVTPVLEDIRYEERPVALS